jgi:LysM repeat protein
MRLLRVCLLTIFITAVLLAGAAQAQQQVVHTVQPGENLFRISLRYGVSVDAIVAANGLSSAHTIYVGQRLVIPQGAAISSGTSNRPTLSGSVYAVQRGDTLSGIARRYGLTAMALMQTNGLVSTRIYVGQQLVIPGAGNLALPANEAQAELPPGDVYVVRPGDTLGQIARRFGLSLADLARLNGIANPSLIYPGQTLRLSGAASLPSGGSKRIVVNLTEQHLYAYEGQRLVYSFVISSGMSSSPTRSGEFRVQSKIPRAFGAAWGIWMPFWMGIYWAGSTENGIHALPILPSGQTLWAGLLGRPASYGCIVLGTLEAELLYNWAEIGTPVSVSY